MATIDKLYLKYCNRVQRYLEEDPYYQYLLELIAAGKPTITQMNRVLDKSVDEKWLEAIEAAIPAIHEIIAHPKRFLKTTEEVKPVEKVNKIGTATIQHLASHTQFITGMRGDTIYPGKLLTVEVDESIDLYENRFVNTLIRKLAEFIEKRTGALFWDTGNEQSSVLRVEDTVEDDYEVIEYKLDMTIHSKQTYLENDASKIEIFKRIDRVRRVIADFRQSAFVAAMVNTGTVQSPVQRTNQIMKNPDYRKCYDLWQFLERYDQVGYAIDVRETALDFDEDYLFQVYGNLALGYTVFKSLLEADQRRITEPPKRRKNIKPKFVKQIVEEFVDDYDLPDVEIRQVIIEEVTKAQTEIERRTQEIKAKRPSAAAREKEKERLAKQKEKEREKAKLAKQKEQEKARLAKQKEKEREKAKLAKQKELEKARLAKQKEKEREKAKLAKQKELEKAKLAKQKELEKAKAAALKEKEAAKAAAEKDAAVKAPTPKAPAATPKAEPTAPKPRAPRKPKVPVEAAPEPITEPIPEPVVAAEPEPVVEPVVAAEPEPIVIPEQEPIVATEPEPVIIPEEEPIVPAEPVPEILPEPEVETVQPPDFLELLTDVAPEAAAEPEPEPKPIPQPEPEPDPEPISPAKPTPASNPLTEWIRRRREREKRQ